MDIDRGAVRTLLQSGDLRTLFVEELGWDRFGRNTQPLEVVVDEYTYQLEQIAHKRGMVVYGCAPDAAGLAPDYATRLKIDKKVAAVTYEHIIVYFDRGRQIWQWVKREPNRPAMPREEHYYYGTGGDDLIQRLGIIAVALADEEELDLGDVAARVKKAFDVETVTKRFYDRFQKEHRAFLQFIQGIREMGDREWYASLMLNRLMFIYFIQRKGFLDGDRDYLRNRMDAMRRQQGKDTFHTFYRYFLLRLFHEGLGSQERNAELDRLLGRVPYLNGGLFEVHRLEQENAIEVPDEAFERIFDFFDEWRWHLDERPLRPGNEINPDVLGYIFEKYINQKQMGAYYTKEDITGYIGQNTIIPFLLDRTARDCAIAFRPDGAVWGLLRADPDRYIYPAVRQGVDVPLPDEIAAGLPDVSRRAGWNRPAAADYALPAETWREHVARRTRCLDLRAKLAAGDVYEVNDLVMLNLDLRRFAEDAIRESEGPELVRAFYRALTGLSVLDPTCGSGAFLFAALTILEPLYDACLDRMRAFVDDDDRRLATASTSTDNPAAPGSAGVSPVPVPAQETADTQPAHVVPSGSAGFQPAPVPGIVGNPPPYSGARDEGRGVSHTPSSVPLSSPSLAGGTRRYTDFRKTLDRMKDHPNRRYFILKSIIIDNLYGVDIMEEAVEICKLRLFLKLVAQVEPPRPIEPLPDIDFNIRAGNTLVGFASYDDVKQAVERKFDFDNTMARIAEDAEVADRAYRMFRQMQVEHGMDARRFSATKLELRGRLAALRDTLNGYLAREYGKDPADEAEYEQWLASHQPFHWFVAFYGIMQRGGFDVIIGNPPYVELSKLKGAYRIKGYTTESCGNLYCPMMERSVSLLNETGKLGMIVPLSVACTERMSPMRRFLKSNVGSLWLSHFSGDANPSKLFEGVKFRLDIVLAARDHKHTVFSSAYLKWFADERDALFDRITYTMVDARTQHLGLIPKLGHPVVANVLMKLLKQPLLEQYIGINSQPIYVHRVLTMYVKCFDFVPYFWNEAEGEKKSEDYKPYRFLSEQDAAQALAIINSSLFFLYFVTLGDCFHCGKEYVLAFPAGLDGLIRDARVSLTDLGRRLMEDLRKHAVRRIAQSQKTGRVEYDEFWPRYSKGLIDKIDGVLAQHYGFTDEELDFIINYDIKYRMGRDAGEDEE